MDSDSLGANGRHPVRLVLIYMVIYGPSLPYWELGAIQSLKVDCVSANKESLGLKNDWLNIDLTGGG